MDSREDRPDRRWPSAGAGALVLVGLAGLAITQPVLDLMGRNPEFFVAGSYTSSQIVWFGAIVALVPSPSSCSSTACPGSPTGGWARTCSCVLVAGLGALFGNVLVRGLGLDNGWSASARGDPGGRRWPVLLVRARAGGCSCSTSPSPTCSSWSPSCS